MGGCVASPAPEEHPPKLRPEAHSIADLSTDEYADELAARTNEVRLHEGLDTLEESSCAQAAALERASALIGEELKHAPLTPVIEECAPMMTAAENLVDSAASPSEVVDAWMRSAGHRANIIDPALTELGVACVEDNAQLLCAQVFLGP